MSSPAGPANAATGRAHAEALVRRLGLVLPTPTPTHYAYQPAIRHGDVVHVAGQIPKTAPDRLMASGVLGESVPFELACEATRCCVLHALAWVVELAGSLDRVARVTRVNYFFQVGPQPFGRMSEIADSGSQLLVELLGDAGRHPRSVIGVRELPRNAPVLLDMDVAVGQGLTQGG